MQSHDECRHKRDLSEQRIRENRAQVGNIHAVITHHQSANSQDHAQYGKTVHGVIIQIK